MRIWMLTLVWIASFATATGQTIRIDFNKKKPSTQQPARPYSRSTPAANSPRQTYPQRPQISTAPVAVSTSATNEFYIGFAERNKKVLLTTTSPVSGYELSKTTGSFSYTIKSVDANGKPEKVDFDYYCQLYGKDRRESFRVIFADRIPIAYSGGASYSAEFNVPIYSNENTSSIVVSSKSYPYESGFGYIGQQIGASVQRLKMIYGLYRNFLKRDREASQTFREVIQNQAYYKTKFSSPNGALAIFSKTIAYATFEWKKNQNWIQGIDSEYYLDYGKDINRDDFFIKNISNKPVLIFGVRVKQDGNEFLYIDESFVLDPGDIIPYADITTQPNFDVYRPNTVYFYADTGIVKKVKYNPADTRYSISYEDHRVKYRKL